ncbi:LytR/AlgR family response regulator transcription factor [Pseudoalteromonas fenneropenaei]|uniref:LytR/AlgR family response regulator transcription factor n=1 Tax=Pseudoalteromonas fenneropenaei TaxID=1737459 RepID=A0ABV7CMZ9_9GAMM
MNYLIVDDEPLARARLQRLLQNHPHWHKLGEASNAQQALQLSVTLNPQVVFVDINLPGHSGLELATELRAKLPSLHIVFVTAHPQFALAAFDVFAAGYLVKPLSEEKLAAVLLQLSAKEQQTQAKLSASIKVQQGGVLTWVAVADILVAQAEDKYTRIYTQTNQMLVDNSLKSLLQDYPHHFIQVHRQTLVAQHAIEFVQSKDGQHNIKVRGITPLFPVSRRAYSQLKAK